MKVPRRSWTARWVAMTRAGLDRPELPTGDAEAEARLYATLGPTLPLRRLARGRTWLERMGRRTAFVDLLAIEAIRGGVTQVVIVGAGYDGRAMRFATPGVTFFELDRPAMQADKRARLARDANAVTWVPIDLNEGDVASALAAAGHDASGPSLFIVEGVLPYLNRGAAEQLFATLRRSAGPGSRLIVSIPVVADGGESWGRRFRNRMLSIVGEPLVTEFAREDVDQLLTSHGWHQAHVEGRPLRVAGEVGVLLAADLDDRTANTGR